jgi:sec-independent protein translocase protein TatC
MLTCGLSFQTPVIMVVLDKIRLIPFERQRKVWKEYVACITIISAIITPPDIISMLFLCVPLVMLYCATIFVVYLMDTEKTH